MTGSLKAAAEWIGDKSIRVVEKHYILTRDEALRKTAALLPELAVIDEEVVHRS